MRPGDQPYLQTGKARAGWLMGGMEAGFSGGCEACPVGWPFPRAGKGRRGAIRLGDPRGALRRRFLEGGFGESLRRGTRGGSAEGWMISPAVRSEIHSRRRRSGDNLPRNPTGVDTVRRRMLAARAPLQHTTWRNAPNANRSTAEELGRAAGGHPTSRRKVSWSMAPLGPGGR